MTPDPRSSEDPQWSLERLDKAYQQGYMAGLTGQPSSPHRQPAEVLAAAWEAGWDDGHRQRRLQRKRA